MTDYLILFLIVFGIHLTPAFTPPTWPVIVLYSLSMRMPLPLLVVSAAIGAALGRYGLAHISRLLAHRLGEKTRRNLDACAELARRERGKALVFGLFALSPVPSAQLFEAAGIVRARLIGPTTAFLAGRLGFYSLYALAAYSIGQSSFSEVFHDKLTSPIFIGFQIGILALLAGFIHLDWTRLLVKRP